MVEHVSLEDFIDRFRDYGRDNHFSREGLVALFNYYEDLEDDMQESITLDVVGICCDWAEYADLEELQADWGGYNLDYFRERTNVIELDNGHILLEAF